MTAAGHADVMDLLGRAITARVTPGAVVEAGTRGRVAAQWTAGTLTYERGAAETTAETLYDLASLTKVVATASVAMQAVTAGALPLTTRVADRFPGFMGRDRQEITVEDLLLHAAGLPAHRPYYRTYAGPRAFRLAVTTERLAYLRRARSEYSDLGFMLLGWLLEDALGRALSDAFSAFVDQAIGPVPLHYGVPPARLASVAPTEADPWRGRVIVGEVHDSNAAALGGAAGHAGLFGTAGAVGAFARWFLRVWRGDDRMSAGVSHDVAARFARRGPVADSSRALAWDTMLPTSSCGRLLSAESIGHTGFTGTSLWMDPVRDLYVVLLTNRVHPASANTLDGIRELRIAVHDAIARHWPPAV